MKITKSTLAVAGGLFLSALAVPFVAPKAAHALAATLVQVTNTASNPVITQNVDSPGRSPWKQTVICNSNNTTQCTVVFPQVPANQRLVVEFVSSTIQTPTTMHEEELDDRGTFESVNFTLQAVKGGINTYVTSQPVLYYFDPGDTPEFVAVADGTNTLLLGQVTMVGHLIDLTQ